MKTKFNVKGMSCSACALGIEKHLNKLEGVKSAAVSLMTESMLVEYDEKIISTDMIIGKVNKLGYHASLFGTQGKEPKTVDKMLVRFSVSLVLLLPILYLSMGGMLGLSLPNAGVGYVIQLFLTVVVLLVNNKFFINGTRAVVNKAANMDTLVALSAGGSFVFSLVASVMYFTKGYTGHVFFESAAMVVTLVTLGKWLEDKSKRKTGREIEKLSKIVPEEVTVIENGVEKVIATSDVEIGAVLLFRTGDYVAIDGKVTDGFAFVDKAAITGESMPVEVGVGENVISGSIIKSGYVKVVACKVGEDTLFSKIIESVRAAGASKAPVQKFADKVAGIFVPVVVAISIVTFFIWFVLTKDVYLSFNFALSVLVISCPCALGLATPVAIMAATGKAATLGILYKDAESIQKAQNINCVLLDKTATITEGEPKVVEIKYFTEEKRVKDIASTIESKSTHPLAVCIRDFLGGSNADCESYEYIAGRGTVAVVDGVKYYLGNHKLVEAVYDKSADDLQNRFSAKGYTTVFLADENAILAVFAISDMIKSDSIEAIVALNSHGIQTVMVTGDNEGAAKAIADQANISDYVAGVLPDGKADVVKQYQKSGKYVAMVGDGINDSPAIKTADVGIAVGTGTDIAIDSADIVIAGGSLKGILDSILLSKKSNKIIKGNLFWAFFYNVIAIPLAAGVLYTAGMTLTPAIAAVCMCLSSLFVVTNALRITRFKSTFKKDATDACGMNCAINTVEDNAGNKSDNVKNENDIKGDDKMKTIYVEGMMCMHCVKHVQDALTQLEGVTKVDVDLETKRVDITFNRPVDDKAIDKAITEAGYTVI